MSSEVSNTNNNLPVNNGVEASGKNGALSGHEVIPLGTSKTIYLTQNRKNMIAVALLIVGIAMSGGFAAVALGGLASVAAIVSTIAWIATGSTLGGLGLVYLFMQYLHKDRVRVLEKIAKEANKDTFVFTGYAGYVAEPNNPSYESLKGAYDLIVKKQNLIHRPLANAKFHLSETSEQYDPTLHKRLAEVVKSLENTLGKYDAKLHELVREMYLSQLKEIDQRLKDLTSKYGLTELTVTNIHVPDHERLQAISDYQTEYNVLNEHLKYLKSNITEEHIKQDINIRFVMDRCDRIEKLTPESLRKKFLIALRETEMQVAVSKKVENLISDYNALQEELMREIGSRDGLQEQLRNAFRSRIELLQKTKNEIIDQLAGFSKGDLSENLQPQIQQLREVLEGIKIQELTFKLDTVSRIESMGLQIAAYHRRSSELRALIDWITTQSDPRDFNRIREGMKAHEAHKKTIENIVRAMKPAIDSHLSGRYEPLEQAAMQLGVEEIERMLAEKLFLYGFEIQNRFETDVAKLKADLYPFGPIEERERDEYFQKVKQLKARVSAAKKQARGRAILKPYFEGIERTLNGLPSNVQQYQAWLTSPETQLKIRQLNEIKNRLDLLESSPESARMMDLASSLDNEFAGLKRLKFAQVDAINRKLGGRTFVEFLKFHETLKNNMDRLAKIKQDTNVEDLRKLAADLDGNFPQRGTWEYEAMNKKLGGRTFNQYLEEQLEKCFTPNQDDTDEFADELRGKIILGAHFGLWDIDHCRDVGLEVRGNILNIHNALQEIGIGSIADLRTHRIYNRYHLKKYIEAPRPVPAAS